MGAPGSGGATADLLVLDHVTKRYGSLAAVQDLSLRVRAGERHALIGPNGAGKSTLFQMVAGALPSTSGRILFAGRDVTGLPEHRRARLGISRTYQQSSVFDGLCVARNVSIAVQRHVGRSRSVLRRASSETGVWQGVDECLARVGLESWADTPAGELSHGQRRQLEVALALATRPRLLLMDEPTAGMSAQESARLIDFVAGLPDDLTILIVEHDMSVVFSLATRVSVLEAGRLLADGAPEEIRDSAAVQKAYLGPAGTGNVGGRP
jgi:branched-chain amino acid transport system ATP-binding protein